MADTQKRPKRRRRRQRLALPVRLVLVGLFVTGAALGAIVSAVVVRSWTQHHPAPVVFPGVPDPIATPPAAYAWTEAPAPLFPIPPYARHLDGVRIVLDPGHIGQRDKGGGWKRGPTGLREAEANLRVALFLREFLAASGADVLMTREVDRSLEMSDDADLRDRARVANEARADLLLSIHHNGNDKPEPNYTSLFYHDDAPWTPASIAAARHLADGLHDALRLETLLEAPVLSDRLLYANGLAVLRMADMPAVLSEASFHSNPQEEARLRDPVYNRREAYGLFLGMARWAAAGLPRVRLIEPDDGVVRAGGSVTVMLDDGLRRRGGWGADRFDIRSDEIAARIAGQSAAFRFDAKNSTLRIDVPRGVKAGARDLVVQFRNAYGQPAINPRIALTVR